MRLSACIAISCLVLFGCKTSNTMTLDTPGYSPQSAAAWRPVALTPEQSKAVTEAVTRTLKDPYSAQFGRLNAAVSDTGQFIPVCGTVNAKNGFGGYSGYSSFYAALDVADPNKAKLISMASRPSDEAAILRFCNNYGLIAS